MPEGAGVGRGHEADGQARAAWTPVPTTIGARRIRELEQGLDCQLLERSPRGVLLTDGGRVLLDEAKELLEHAERAKEKVRRSTGHRTIVVGAVAGAGAALDARGQETFRRRHPRAAVRLRECGLTDPSAGLRTGQVDVALTRLPFDTTGIAIRVLHEEPLVAVMPSNDPLAGSARIDVSDLRGRTTFRLPPGADPQWRDFWLAAGSDDPDTPVVSTIGDCLHAVVWQSAVGLLPAAAAHRHATPGVSFVPVIGHRPSRVVRRPAAPPRPRTLCRRFTTRPLSAQSRASRGPTTRC